MWNIIGLNQISEIQSGTTIIIYYFEGTNNTLKPETVLLLKNKYDMTVFTGPIVYMVYPCEKFQQHIF